MLPCVRGVHLRAKQREVDVLVPDYQTGIGRMELGFRHAQCCDGGGDGRRAPAGGTGAGHDR